MLGSHGGRNGTVKQPPHCGSAILAVETFPIPDSSILEINLIPWCYLDRYKQQPARWLGSPAMKRRPARFACTIARQSRKAADGSIRSDFLHEESSADVDFVTWRDVGLLWMGKLALNDMRRPSPVGDHSRGHDGYCPRQDRLSICCGQSDQSGL